jgi:tRNA-2-methylthio-N6-dimethylallyladenosine synthase
MAERLKQSLLDDEKLVDLVVGQTPRDLPRLLNRAEDEDKGINVAPFEGLSLI